MIDNEPELIIKSARKEAGRLELTLADMKSYLQGMTRVLDDEAIKGQELFSKEIKNYGLQE